MKKLVLLFASLLFSMNLALAKGVSMLESSNQTFVPASAEIMEPAKSEKVAGSNKDKVTATKLTKIQKLALKTLAKPMKKAAMNDSKGGISGGLKTAIIVCAIGLILMILGTVLWLFWFIGAIVLVIGLVLLLLELLG